MTLSDAIYARVSTGRQEQERTIESQLEALSARARERTAAGPAPRVFRDDGFSGARLDRPDVRQIVKSLVFRKAHSGEPVLVLASGGHRVDESWMEREVGEPLSRASPEFVRSVTGFAIGGVPPLGHPSELATFIDYDLLEYPELWAAAGHPNAVFRLSARELLDATGGRAVPVVPPAAFDRSEDRWVTFDCYGTLVDWKSGLFAALEPGTGPMARWDRERLFAAFLGEEQRLEAQEYRAYRTIVVEAVRSAATVVGIAAAGAGADRIPESIPEWPAFPDARNSLERLRTRGVRVAVLSNIDRDLLDQTLERQRLPVDEVVTASEVRSYKPAPAHWIRFLKRIGVSPGRVCHVSGSHYYDVAPARRLGFRTAYVARYREEAEATSEEVAPDLRTLVDRWDS